MALFLLKTWIAIFHLYEVWFWYYEFNTLFSSHLQFGFWTSRSSYPSNSKKILWGTKFLKVPLCRIFIFCFLWNLGIWILTILPSHFYTLVYCRPIHLISIGFQNIDNDLVTPPKKLFLPFQLLQSCNLCGHFEWDFFCKVLG
jgi:hypothetical protein